MRSKNHTHCFLYTFLETAHLQEMADCWKNLMRQRLVNLEALQTTLVVVLDNKIVSFKKQTIFKSQTQQSAHKFSAGGSFFLYSVQQWRLCYKSIISFSISFVSVDLSASLHAYQTRLTCIIAFRYLVLILF